MVNVVDETNAFISIDRPKGVAAAFTLHLRGKFKPREKDTKFEFGLTVAGRAKVSIYVTEFVKGQTSHTLL